INNISSQLMPFCPPCIPSINAQGSSPISIGELSLMPRINSLCGEGVHNVRLHNRKGGNYTLATDFKTKPICCVSA
ncbi:hypothetical protein MM710_38565, partial [Klebsiella pneumoniae]|nr:hypothetical protein [Klebsiella pneumoniae]